MVFLPPSAPLRSEGEVVVFRGATPASRLQPAKQPDYNTSTRNPPPLRSEGEVMVFRGAPSAPTCSLSASAAPLLRRIGGDRRHY